MGHETDSDNESVAAPQIPWIGNGKLQLGGLNPSRTSPLDSLTRPASGISNLVGGSRPTLGVLPTHRNRLGATSPLLGNAQMPSLFDRNEHPTFSLPTAPRLETPEINLPNLFERQQSHHSPPSIFNRNQQTPSIPPIRKQTHCTCYCDI